MKICIAFLALFATTVLSHAETPAAAPSDESLKELLALTDTKKLITDMQAQMKSTMAASMSAALQGQKLNADQQTVMEKFQGKVTDLMAQEFGWEQMEALYMQIYRESFSQSEINDLIVFYKSSTGQMFIKKMPVIMQKSMTVMQQRMVPMMGKIKTLQQEIFTELQAAKTPAKSSGGGGSGQ